MIHVVNLFVNHLLIESWDISLSDTFGGSKDEKSARHS